MDLGRFLNAFEVWLRGRMEAEQFARWRAEVDAPPRQARRAYSEDRRPAPVTRRPGFHAMQALADAGGDE